MFIAFRSLYGSSTFAIKNNYARMRQYVYLRDLSKMFSRYHLHDLSCVWFIYLPMYLCACKIEWKDIFWYNIMNQSCNTHESIFIYLYIFLEIIRVVIMSHFSIVKNFLRHLSKIILYDIYALLECVLYIVRDNVSFLSLQIVWRQMAFR